MPRSKNSIDTIQVTVSITYKIRDDLEILTKEGYYGKNIAETMANLLSEILRSKRKAGDIPTTN